MNWTGCGRKRSLFNISSWHLTEGLESVTKYLQSGVRTENLMWDLLNMKYECKSMDHWFFFFPRIFWIPKGCFVLSVNSAVLCRISFLMPLTYIFYRNVSGSNVWNFLIKRGIPQFVPDYSIYIDAAKLLTGKTSLCISRRVPYRSGNTDWLHDACLSVCLSVCSHSEADFISN